MWNTECANPWNWMERNDIKIANERRRRMKLDVILIQLKRKDEELTPIPGLAGSYEYI